MKNLCLLAILCVSVTPLLSYILPQECACPKYYDPVCGTDGVTYSNICFLKCAQQCNNPWLGYAYHGECEYNSCGYSSRGCSSYGTWKYGTYAPGYY